MSSYSGQISSMRSRISSIEREIRQVDNENNQLQNEINTMVNAVRDANSGVVQLYDFSKKAIDNGGKEINADEKTLTEAGQIQDAIKIMHADYKSVEKAYKTIRKLNGELKVLDENNLKVNRTMIALMDFLRGGIISRQTIFKNVEMLHPMTKDYYMSYIMVAVASWINDKQDEAKRAVEMAMQLDKRMTTVFFFVFWTKQERYDVARAWLEVLMKGGLCSEDKSLLFLIVLFSLDIGGQKLDKNFVEEIKAYVNDICIKSQNDQTYAIVAKINKWYNSIVGAETLSFAELANCVDEYPIMMSAMNMCKANDDILQALVDITEPSLMKVNERYIDGMLENFILSSKSRLGAEIADRIALQEEIIASGGKESIATVAKSEKDIKKMEKINVKENMYDWLQIKESFEGERKVNIYAYNNLRNLYATAYTQYYSDYNNKLPREISIKTENYSAKTKFENLEDEVKNIEIKLEEKKHIEVRSSRRLWRFILYPALAIAFLTLASVFVKNIYFAPIGFCLFGVNVCATLVAMYRNKSIKAKIEDKYCQQKYEAKEKIATLFGEYQRFKTMYEKYDGVSKKIYALLASPKNID